MNNNLTKLLSLLFIAVVLPVYITGQHTVIHAGATLINDGTLAIEQYESPASNNFMIRAGGELIFGPGSVVVLYDTLQIEDSALLLLADGASVGTGINARIIIENNGNYINFSSSDPYLEARRIMEGEKGWRMIGSPVGTSFADLCSSPFVTQGFPGSTFSEKMPNLLWFDETDGGTTLQSWRMPSYLSDSITGGLGHYFYIFNGAGLSGSENNYSDTLPFTMSANGFEYSFTEGSFDFGVSFTPRILPAWPSGPDDTIFNDNNMADAGWNLLSNPTASTLDWDSESGWIKSSVDNVIYMWEPSANEGNGEFLFWSSDSTASTLNSGLIAPFRSFWVHAHAAGPALVCNQDSKSMQGLRYAEEPVKDIAMPALTLELTLQAATLRARAFLTFREGANAGHDPCDAYRLEPLHNTWLELFTLSSPAHVSPLVLNNLPLHDDDMLIIPLYVGGQVDGYGLDELFRLEWKLPGDWPADWNVSLHDHRLQKVTSMTGQAQYTFSYTSQTTKTTGANGPVLPEMLFRPVSQSSMLKSGSQPPPFSIVIRRGNILDEPDYMALRPHLLPNYPNPFSYSTTLRFSLPEEASVRLDVFDCNGLCVGSPINSIYPAGITEINYMPPVGVTGLVIFRMISGEVVEAAKGVVIK